jgi:hypothetical protein
MMASVAFFFCADNDFVAGFLAFWLLEADVVTTGVVGFLIVTSRSLSEPLFVLTESVDLLRSRTTILFTGSAFFLAAAAFFAAAAAASLAAPEPFF